MQVNTQEGVKLCNNKLQSVKKIEILNFSHRSREKLEKLVVHMKPTYFLIKLMNNNKRDAEICVEKTRFKLLVL